MGDLINRKHEFLMKNLKPLDKPVGDFILNNATGVMSNNGMYYHYSEVCKLLKKFQQQTTN